VKRIADQTEILLLVCIVFGYLIGMLLRLFRTEPADNWSAMWIRFFRRMPNKKELDVTEEFPYIGWLGEVCKGYLTPGAYGFYREFWLPRKRAGQNRQFFNFCKTLINSVDERASAEIAAAETFSRYISAMLYALVLACILIFIAIVCQFLWVGQPTLTLWAILIAYHFAIVVILNYFRHMRIKEVELVFAASLQNRAIFEKQDLEDIQNPASRDQSEKFDYPD
jgi:heme/copper-type cytochrome/quinol oxidase subunit 4